MRVLASAALPGLIALLLSAPAPAQEKGEKPKSRFVSDIAGKTADVWIAEIHSKDPSKRENAIRTILLFGPEQAQAAIPALIAELKKHTSTTPVDVSVRVNGSIALGEILGAAEAGLAPRPKAKEMTDAVTVLVRMLRDTQAIVKYRAAQALGKIGPPARVAVPDLLYALHDPATWETRQAAAFALGRVSSDPKQGISASVLTELFRAVKSDHAAQVRLAAIQALVYLGRPALPTHQKQLDAALEYVIVQDPEKSVKIWAHMAAMSLRDRVEPPRVAWIGKLTEDKELLVRIEAIQALGTIGPKAKSQVAHLIKGLDDPEKAVVGWSTWALARMGKDAKDAVPRLQALEKNKDNPEPLRQMARDAVQEIEGRTPAKEDAKTPVAPMGARQ
jgi:hypothetical protein